MSEITQKQEEDLQNAISSSLGELREIAQLSKLLTSLPPTGFIVAIFSLIVFLASPKTLEAFSEEHRIGVFILIVLILLGIGLYVKQFNTQARRQVELIHYKTQRTEATLKELQNKYKNLRESASILSQIINETKQIKEDLSHSQEESAEVLISNLLLKLENYRSNLNQIILSGNFNNQHDFTDEQGIQLTDLLDSIDK